MKLDFFFFILPHCYYYLLAQLNLIGGSWWHCILYECFLLQPAITAIFLTEHLQLLEYFSFYLHFLLKQVCKKEHYGGQPIIECTINTAIHQTTHTLQIFTDFGMLMLVGLLAQTTKKPSTN